MQKKLISAIYIKAGKAVCGFHDSRSFGDGDAVRLAEDYSNRGADALLIFDLSDGDEEHEQSLGLIKEMSRRVDIPMYGLGNIRRTEDVKKLLYAGCRRAVLNWGKPSNREMLKEVSNRFGREKIGVCMDARTLAGQERAAVCGGNGPDPDGEGVLEEYDTPEDIARYAGAVIWLTGDPQAARRIADGFAAGVDKLPKTPETEQIALFSGREFTGEELRVLLSGETISGVSDERLRDEAADLMALKGALRAAQIPVNTYESDFSWNDFKLNPDGLIPVVVQDYKTQEVLMAAYMNQEAYETTLRSGRMTYWSRSRQELWVKGLTSGHFQYVKELRIDCDNDTILAKVAQVGAACHTGNRSCFYRTMVKKDYVERNPMKIFEEVYGVIEDRRLHPKEGSYTNYLFDKGLDKILKKVGEEASEIIIAAKNPNPEEVKYEISDFLYHMMVLMAQKGITWEEIAQELADR